MRWYTFSAIATFLKLLSGRGQHQRQLWALTQVAVIAARCHVGHICMVGGGGCSCMLLLYHIPTSADAGPDLCTLCPNLCTLHPNLVVLSLFQLVQTFHLHRWWLSSVATCIRGAYAQSHMYMDGGMDYKQLLTQYSRGKHTLTWWLYLLQNSLQQ